MKMTANFIAHRFRRQRLTQKSAALALAFAMVLTGLPVSSQAALDNILVNPSFEIDLGGAGAWDNTADRGLSTPVVADAPQGSRVLRISEAALANGQFGFTFQGPFPINPGDRVSFSGRVREVVDDADATDEIPQLVIEFQTPNGNIQNAEGTSSAAFTTVTETATAPPGTTGVVFVVRLQNASDGGGTSVGEFDALVASINQHGVAIDAALSQDQVSPGEMTMVIARVTNNTADTLSEVEIVAEPQAGINIYRHQSALDGNRIPTREGSTIFSLGSLDPGQESVLTFPAILTSAVQPGKTYNIALTARFLGGGGISQTTYVEILVENDPVFHEGTIIGKVFHDENQNGVQDNAEKGVPYVRLVTEEGIIIITDEDGKYSIPAVKPGRHIVKIDGHSLPQGTKFITEEAYLVKTTPGILNKANFAVLLPPSEIPEEFSEELTVHFSEGLDTSRPTLNVQMTPHVLRAGLGTLEQPAVFRFHLNYPDFVKNWYLEIRDKTGEEIWTGFGVSAPPSEVTWSGETEDGLLIKPGIYSYRLKVEDFDGHDDWTPLYFFRVLSKADGAKEEYKIEEISPIGNFNICKDGKSSIPLVAKPTVRIQGTTKPGYEVRINSRPVPVTPEGKYSTEFYVTPGEKEFLVEAASPEGSVTTYRKNMVVKDSTFFMVALGEEQLGVNFSRGNLETTGKDDQFRDDFYEDGRLSYFLKGKLKGKFLYESHYDTDDKRSELFRNLDPDEYYPIYGDNSTIDYDAINTQQRFYILVEMDRSFVKWGSYQTEFTDTELAYYNRTLSGLKAHYESLDTTSYGDSKRGVTAFWSQSRHRADHNEFAATGGSLYYLRNRRVIEGSEKLRVEIRDKIQGMAIESYDLAEGKDYEIDYEEGRILLSRPLSSIAASDTLVTADILDGSPVFLIADYEYDAGTNAVEEGNRGLRGYTHMGDHIRLGGTAVKENRHGLSSTDYDLRAVDMQVKVGRSTKVTAEYAESKQQQMNQSVSYNGGLSFNDQSLLRGVNTRPRENAYLIKAESMPHEKVAVSGYVQGVEPSFSNAHIKSEEGTKKYGLAVKYDITKNLYARYRFDSSEIVGQLLPLVNHGLSANFEDRVSHTAQLVYDNGAWLGQAEYLRQLTHYPPPSNLLRSLSSEYPFDNGLAFKLGYRVDENLLPYAKFQTTFPDKNNYLVGGGLRYRVAQDTFAYFEEMVGNLGDSTLFGLEKQHDERSRSYANIRMRDQGIGTKTLSTTIGSSYAVTEKSRIFSEREHSNYNSVNGYADILGYEGDVNDHWDYELRYERRHLDASSSQGLDILAENDLARANTYNTASGALAYADGDKLRARTYLELRRDSDAPKLWQWVSRNSAEYQINEDLGYLGRLDFGKSRFTDPGDNVADFLEFNTGFSYRPVSHDKFNMLSRYTYLRNSGSDAQFISPLYQGVEVDETSHIIAIDFAYDIYKFLTLVEKLAYKNSILDSSVTNEELMLHNFLWINRFNYHVTRKWDVAVEYRTLWQFDLARTLKHGALVEVDREFYEYVRFGIGYNFTDFDDDLRSNNNYDSHGPFVRLTGKF